MKTTALLIRPELHADESLPSLVLRGANANRVDTDDILAVAGLRPGSLSSLPFSPIEQGKVAALFRLPTEALSKHAYLASNDNGQDVAFMGGLVNRADIQMTYRRYSPRALNDMPYHRMAWDLGAITADPETGETLIDRCPGCQQRLRWYGASLDKCRTCGVKLLGAKSALAPGDERQFSTLVARLLDHDQEVSQAAKDTLPTSLQPLSVGELISLTTYVGAIAIRYLKSDKLAGSSPLTVGIRLLFQWSRSVEDIISQVLGMDSEDGRIAGVEFWERHQYIVDANLPGRAKALIQKAVKATLDHGNQYPLL